VQTFAPNAAGSVQPISSLQASGLSAPTGLDFDVTGDVFVSDPAADSILEFPSATGSSTPFATIVGPDTGLAGPAFLSELPPPPAPRLRLSTNRRQSRKRILDNGVVLLVRASGAMAFRGQPVSISALARVGRSTIARAKPIPLRPGRLTLRLLTNRRAGSLLRRRHRGLITLTIIVRGDAGTQRRHLTITCTG
jgi:hypothetical protein